MPSRYVNSDEWLNGYNTWEQKYQEILALLVTNEFEKLAKKQAEQR